MTSDTRCEWGEEEREEERKTNDRRCFTNAFFFREELSCVLTSVRLNCYYFLLHGVCVFVSCLLSFTQLVLLWSSEAPFCATFLETDPSVFLKTCFTAVIFYQFLRLLSVIFECKTNYLIPPHFFTFRSLIALSGGAYVAPI